MDGYGRSGVWSVSGLLTSHRTPAFKGASRRALQLLVALALGAVCLIQTGRLAAFMVHPARYSDSIRPVSIFFLRHSCLTSHFQAARLQRAGVSNLYDTSHYLGPDGDPAVVEGFSCDLYLYPPTALLLPRVALAMSSDFLAWRTTWFFLEATFLLLALALLARWVVGAERITSLIVCLIVFAAPTTMLALQIGNLHLAVFAASIVAMIAFERNAYALGGAMLAWAVVSKLFPGILVLVLLMQRRWGAAAWTAAWTLFFVIASIIAIGPAPFTAFIRYQLPRLASGDAWAQVFAYPQTSLINDGVIGLAHKLELMAVTDVSHLLQGVLPPVSLAVLLAAVFVGSRVNADKRSIALVWLALLQLASLQSPFVPDVYAHFGWTCMLALMLVTQTSWSWRVAVLLILLASASYQDAYFFVTSETWRTMLATLHQMGMLALTLYPIVHSHRSKRRTLKATIAIPPPRDVLTLR
jgi:Glycosyltransferase family 87